MDWGHRKAHLARATRWFISLLFVSILLSISPTATTYGDQGDFTATVSQTGNAPAYFVELSEPPAARVFADSLRRAPARLDLAAAATRAQMQLNRQAQATLAVALRAPAIGATEIYRVQRALNGIAVRVNSDRLPAIRALSNVKAVYRIDPEYIDNAQSIPFLGVNNLWNNTIGLGRTLTGAGVSVGIIDTGIDYLHSDFGGTGALTDYQNNNRTGTTSFFPSAKVIGGYDFAGDDYDGSNTPAPDPNPMDCHGHGTHVAGTVAGYGVNADGSRFIGPYYTSVPFDTMRIGPGVAPDASLYALRVFGCTGSTDLTVQAIDWSLDPNNDGDLSDHLDVINMSLGSEFGVLASTSAMASDNAAQAGVIVVASAGNSGGTYMIAGSPASGDAVISVAASADNGAVGPGVRVNTPVSIGGWRAAQTPSFGGAPPPAGVTGNVVIANDPADGAGPSTTDGCSPLTNGAQITGNIALIDRGTCNFTVKVKNAQDAGAIGVVIASSASGAWTGMSGSDPTVTIPSAMVSYADGNTLKANIATLNVTLFPAGDTLASFSSQGPRGGAVTFLKPDIAAPGVNIVSAQSGTTCTTGSCITPNGTGYLAGNGSVTLSGTSMAAPHLAGTMALLRQEHPTWSSQELKALVMNGALHDITQYPNGAGARNSPSRIGAGRVDPAISAQLNVVAYNAQAPQQVSVTFDTVVTGTTTLTKQIHVVNHSSSAVSYNLAIDSILDAPGVSFSFPNGALINIPGNQAIDFPVQLTAIPAQMQHTRDPLVSPTQAAPSPLTSLGNLGRHWLTEEAGYVTFSAGGNVKLRVPVYAALRPASAMSAVGPLLTGGAVSGSTTLPLAGTGVCTGTLNGASCTGSFPTDEVSLVTPFELQVSSPRNTELPASQDLQYAGVAYDAGNNLVLFGVSTWGDWGTPSEVAFNIYIDNNSDGTYDRVLFNSNPGRMASSLFGTTGTSQDSFTNATIDLVSYSVYLGGNGLYVNGASPASVDSALFKTNVLFLAATPTQLGLATGTTAFRYKIMTCPGYAPVCDALYDFHSDVAEGPYRWNYAAQGLNFGGVRLSSDLNGASLPVTWNVTNFKANGSLGALLLHHHNAPDARAQTMPFTNLYFLPQMGK